MSEANEVAKRNNADKRDSDRKIYTILFFDEANTTEAIGLIKEIMCDNFKDSHLQFDPFLRIVAACNPYRRYAVIYK